MSLWIATSVRYAGPVDGSLMRIAIMIAGFIGTACTTAVPPPTFMSGMPLNSGIKATGVELGGTGPLVAGIEEPILDTDWAASLSGAHSVGRAVVLEFRALTRPGNSVAGSPGVWIRTRIPSLNHGTFGLRLGIAAGLGDLTGISDFRLPYGGPTAHLQVTAPVTGQTKAPRLGVTFGAEYLVTPTNWSIPNPAATPPNPYGYDNDDIYAPPRTSMPSMHCGGLYHLEPNCPSRTNLHSSQD
ncbi:MAG: hypothetical protein AAGA48_09095 [Myxococcota bacterium]